MKDKTQHTQIEKWIEQSAKEWFSKEIFKSDHIADSISYIQGAKNVLEYVGLAGIDNPAEWVQWHKNIALTNAELNQQIKQLQSELKSVKDFNEVLIREHNWEIEVVRPDLDRQIKQLQSEIKQLKGE